ncbi:MAG: hypothetical protein AAFS00_09305 [Bacteroidota bacterium]
MKPLHTISLFALLSFFILSCDSAEQVDDLVQTVTNSIDGAVGTLGDASSDWQSVLGELKRDLPADVQSTVTNEVNNLLTRAVAASGSEIRCDVDFFRARLRQNLLRIKANFLKQDPPPMEPQLCQVVPLAVDMSLEANRRNKIEFYGYDFDITDKLQVLVDNGSERVDITSTLDKPSHYHMTLNLSGSGAQLTKQAKRVILRWGDRDISSIGILQKVPKICETKVVGIRPAAISYLPPHTRGDKNYKKNGPDVYASVQIINLDTLVVARVAMKAEETKGDRSTASGTKDFELYRPDPGWAVQSIVSSPYADYFYRDENDTKDEFAGSGPVQKWIFRGRKKGEAAGVYSNVTLMFNQLRFELKETKDCVAASTVRGLEVSRSISPRTLDQIKKQNKDVEFQLPEEIAVDTVAVDSM